MGQHSARPRVSPPPERDPVKKPFPWVPVLIGLVGMGMILGLLAVAGVAYLYLQSQKDVAVAPLPAPEPVEEVQEELPEPEPKVKPKPKRRSATRRAVPPPVATPVETALPPVSGQFEVTFRVMGSKAKLQCGDGQSGSFVGMTRRKFTHPTTCRVDVGDAKGAVQVAQAGTVNCTVDGANVACAGP